jgi:hypothetical protein
LIPGIFFADRVIDKLVAKSIIFLQELTVEEIFEYIGDRDEFTLEEKNQALKIGLDKVRMNKKVNELVNLGLCEPVAIRLLKSHKYEIAKDILQQDGMSLDAKMMIIFGEK